MADRKQLIPATMRKLSREDAGKNLDPAQVLAVSQGMSFSSYSGGNNTNYKITFPPLAWFGPSQPIQPIAQDPAQGVAGRRFDYPFGYNLRITPRGEEQISFVQLRALADNLDILRLVIETRKDQVEAFQWEIMPMDQKDNSAETTAQKKRVMEFFEQPSTEHDWSTWLRSSLEDVFVIDAWCLYPRMTYGGELYSLDIVDGATITRKLDITGRTPIPPDVAYQQVLHGIPAYDYTAEDLIYLMRNPRSSRVYGLPPVEQVLMTVNIALRKALYQLQYYSEGNIPEALCGVPPEWNMDQIRQFQLYWDSLMEGNTAQRRHMKFIPFDASKIKEIKDPALKDMFDEWLARIVCFAFSIPPTPFVRETNRSTSEQLAEAAREEGIMPLLTWLKRKFDYVIHKYLKADKVQFRWQLSSTISPEAQSTIDVNDVKSGIRSVDEVRESRGWLPRGTDELLVYTASGPVPLKESVESARKALTAPPQPPQPAAGIAGGQPGGERATAGVTGGPAGKGKGEAEVVEAEKVY